MPDFTFALDAPVEDLSTVPTDFQHLYEQGDDGYVVAEQNRPVAETINALAANLANSRKVKKQASDESAERRRTLNAIQETVQNAGYDADEFSAEGLAEFLSSLSSQASGNSEQAAEQLRNQREEMERAKNAAVDAERKKALGYRGAIDNMLIDAKATEAIAANKGVPQLLLPAVKSQTKVVEEDGKFRAVVVDASGDTRFNGHGDPMTISELVTELKGDKVYGRAFEGDVPNGSGKKPDDNGRKPVGPRSQPRTEDKTAADKIAGGLSGLSRR